MTTARDFKADFWKHLDDSAFVMLSLPAIDGGHSQPMSVQFDDDYPDQLYFFTSSDSGWVKGLRETNRALVNHVAKGHDFFSSIHGMIAIDNDPAKIDKFWSPVVAAWFEQGREDPKVTLLRMDLGRAEFWEAGTGSFLKEMASAIFNETAHEEAKKHHIETRFAA
ncbi:MAG: pyridoxamine 5'-phosphate oxidase family protein [Pacificimonas sp.]